VTTHQEHDDEGAGAAERFEALWAAHLGPVHRYVSRHVDAHTAHDVVAETFLVAWRRIDDVPEAPLPWLLVIAKNTIANTRRSATRRRAMESTLARVAHLAAAEPSPGAVVAEREHVLAALGRLSPRHREAVLLVAWDGLDPAGAAQVLGISPAAFAMRLSRARRQLGRAIDEPEDPDEVAALPAPSVTPRPAAAHGDASPRSLR